MENNQQAMSEQQFEANAAKITFKALQELYLAMQQLQHRVDNIETKAKQFGLKF